MQATSRRQKKEQKVSHCHWRVAKVAKELCAETYELVMSKNEVFAEWKRQHPGASRQGLENAFVAKNWGKFIPAARTTLTLLLRTTLDEKTKEEIMETLTLDATLIRGRANPSLVVGSIPNS